MDTFKVDWSAVEAAMADLDNATITEEFSAINKQYRDLLAVRDRAKNARAAERHRAELRSLPTNAPLTYRGYDRRFQGKEMLLEKCNPKYVIVQVRDVPGKKDKWSRWNFNYSELKIGELTEMERSSRFINNTVQRLLGSK